MKKLLILAWLVSGICFASENVTTLRKTVTTAGTEVQLVTAKTQVYYACIRALTANTGNIFVGAALVDSTTGYILVPGAEVCFGRNYSNVPVRLDNIWIDSAVNGEGISVIYQVK